MDCRDVILKTGWVLGRPDHKARWLARTWSSGGELHSNYLSPNPDKPRSYVLVHDSRKGSQVATTAGTRGPQCRLFEVPAPNQYKARQTVDFPPKEGRLTRGSSGGGGSSSKANSLGKKSRPKGRYVLGAVCDGSHQRDARNRVLPFLGRT